MKERPVKAEVIKGEEPPVSIVIEQRLGHIGLEKYGNMPRKTKKAAKKQKLGRALTQLELSRLEAAMRQQKAID